MRGLNEHVRVYKDGWTVGRFFVVKNSANRFAGGGVTLLETAGWNSRKSPVSGTDDKLYFKALAESCSDA